MTKKENNTLNDAVVIATSVAYTKKEVQKLKTELVSFLEEKTKQPIVEYIQGPAGTQGLRGSIGATGAQGERGVKGDTGEQGEQGLKGEVGPQGNMGLEGPRGFKGDKGEQGEVGPQGEQGIQGVAGESGPQGLKGDRGADGQNGLDGKDGEAGATGSAGPIGAQGIQGEQGPRGDRGERGQDGQQGPTGKIGPQGVQGVPGKDGKDADVKAIEQSISQFKEVLQKDVSQYKAKVNTIISSGIGGGGGGSGEVNLRRLDDVDTTNLTDGYVLAFNESIQKFEFVAQSGGGGGTVDTIARTRANSAFTQANSAFAQANTATTLAQAAYNQANTSVTYNQNLNTSNTVSFAGVTVAGNTTVQHVIPSANIIYDLGSSTARFRDLYLSGNTIYLGSTTLTADSIATTAATANASFQQANTATTLAQAAYNQANTGGAGATESLNVVFDNGNATQYKIVALNANAETVLATSLEIGQIDRVLGVLDNAGETVTFGAITNPSWTWTPEQSLYLGSNGIIATTSTIDGAAFSLKIGYAISATKAFIKIGTPVVL